MNEASRAELLALLRGVSDWFDQMQREGKAIPPYRLRWGIDEWIVALHRDPSSATVIEDPPP